MNTRKTILIIALLGIALAALFLFIVRRDAGSVASEPITLKVPGEGAKTNNLLSQPGSTSSVLREGATRVADLEKALAGTALPVDAGNRSAPLLRTVEGRIDPSALASFDALKFPGGKPAYDGAEATAYVALPTTGRKVALTVNQLGEFPRIETKLSEQVEVRMAFTKAKPGDHVAVVAQDGGRLQTGKLSMALALDQNSQIAFAYTVSSNPGAHRLNVTTATGELKTLEFWAGTPPVLMNSAGL